MLIDLTMNQGSPYNRSVLVIFSLVLASMIIISSQFPVAFAGNCKDDDGDLFCDPPDCNDDDKEVYPGHGCPPTSIEDIQDIISDVQDLLSIGDINSGQANALISKLQKAVASIEADKINAAIGKLDSFINQINAYVNSGVLSRGVGDTLIGEVQDIIDDL